MSQTTLLNVLSVHERLDHNYTSNQLLTVLDTALFYAVEAVMRNTTWMDMVLANTVNWYSDNTRRKIASNVKDKNELYGALISIILSNDVDFKIHKLKRLSLERSVWFKAVKTFVALCPDNTTRFHEYQFLAKPTGSLAVAKRDAQYWLRVATDMKVQIMEKYMRHVGKQALYTKSKNPDVDLSDVVQNLTVSLSQAIDKCSSDKGTLTTYINQWFLSAQTKSRGEEYGTAYTIPDTVRKEFFNGRPPNIYVPIHDLEEEGSEGVLADHAPDPSVEIETANLRQRLLRLAKHADPEGYGRYHLGIDEIFN